jgi:acetoin utilization deacetylase AcuC-like enzyme
MKPIRMKLAHHLLMSYGLYRQLEVYVSQAQSPELSWRGLACQTGYSAVNMFSINGKVHFCAQMTCLQRPHLATAEEMKEFHSSDYIDFLRRITPENMHEYASQMQKFGIGEFSDCPAFSGLYDYTRIHAGASIGE